MKLLFGLYACCALSTALASELSCLQTRAESSDGFPSKVTNVSPQAIRIGGFGMPTPANGGTGNIETNIANDAHIGGQHGWVEWVRVVVDEQTLIATPLNNDSAFEAWRPTLEFGGGAFEWSTHTTAWASEWEQNRQWPYLYMGEALNATGFWANPKSPWPCWADGGQTVSTNFTTDRHWNSPTDRVLHPHESVTFGIRLAFADGGPRTRDAALRAVGEPVLRAIPGYTISVDMTTAKLIITPPLGETVSSVTASGLHLTVSAPRNSRGGGVEVAMTGQSHGRSRVSVRFTDGTEAVAHYYVLPSLPDHLARVGKFWSEVAWLPLDYPDPFGRGGSVLPWDRQDGRHRLNDPRAYDVGLSDDAGGGNPLGFATKVAYAPTQKEASTLDDYIQFTLFGIKDGPESGAKRPYKSLQVGGDPAYHSKYECANRTNFKNLGCEGIRMTMFYYNQNYFKWNYTEAYGCGSILDNWCMTESFANATYRGFNYPHQIASYYAAYRIARNHDKILMRQPWEWYLERAALTVLHMGSARIGYMDGTVQREVLRSVLEEDDVAGPKSTWTALANDMVRAQKARADYWSTAKYPYGSEFSYDTTGQEEVVVWLLYFGYDDAAKRTVDHILSYMRSFPGWAFMGGAMAGDIGNGGKWYVVAETGFAEAFGKMHYRAGLNQIPLSEWFRLHPDDFQLLEIAIGAITGQFTNIDNNGAPGMLYNAYPHVQEHDPYTGDYGLGFFGISLESAAYFVNHDTMGPICYLCDITSPSASSNRKRPQLTRGSFELRDAYRARVYFEPLGLWIQADTGNIDSVQFDIAARQMVLVFAAATNTPAGIQSYSKLRLRVDKVARNSSRPGQNFTVISPTGAKYSRSAWEIEPCIDPGKPTAVTLTWLH